MKEKELLKLGFYKNYVTSEESGSNPFEYFSLKIGNIDFLSNDDMDNLYVEILEGKIVITSITDLKILINILKKYESKNNF